MANKLKNFIRQQHFINNKEQFRCITKVFEKQLMWPKGDDPSNINSNFYLKFLLFTVIIPCSPVSLTIYHAYHYRSVANSSLIFDFTVVVILIDFVAMAMTFAYNLKGLVILGNSYYTSGNIHDQELFHIHKTKLNYRRLSKIIIISSIIGSISVSIFKIWNNGNCEKKKLRNNSLESCGLLIPVYLPFDYEFFPIKQCILIHQTIRSVYLAFVVLFHGILVAVLYMDKTVGAMDYLIELVHRITSSIIADDKKVKDYLRKIVNIHETVVRENNDFNCVWRHLTRIFITLARLVIATSIFDILETGSWVSMINCTLWLIGAAGVEFASQIMINKSMEFENALHNVEWYKINKLEDRRSFLLIFLMAQKSISLNEGTFDKMSLPSLLQFLKGTYSYTAMLVRMVK